MKPKNTFLIHPLVDFFMMGGLSLIVLSLFLFLVPQNQSTHSLGWTMFYLSFVVNFPHFLISYQFLYIDNAKKIFKNWRCFIAGILAPLFLISYMVYCFTTGLQGAMGYLFNAMYFLVGWHYVKQIYGCIVVCSALQGFYFTGRERLVLFLHAVSIWFISYFQANISMVKRVEYGLPYMTFAFPPMVLTIVYTLAVFTFLLFSFQMLKKFIHGGKTPPFNSLVAFFTLHAWHIPMLYHPGYFLMIPFFHSLQYLLFSFAYVKNKFSEGLSSLPPVKQRAKWVQNTGGYIFSSFVTGALFFHFIPHFLDKNISYNQELFGPSVFLFCFTVFLNIHHYFIDFAIWRRDNPLIRKYLFT